MPPPAAYWFDDPRTLRAAPSLIRLYLEYCRFVVRRSDGRVRGEAYVRRLVRWLTGRLGRDRTMTVHVNGVALALDFCDPRVLWAIEESRGTNDDARVMRACLGPGDTFIDVGANLGGYTSVAASLVGARGSVIAIEPQPRLAALLRRSFDLNPRTAGAVHQVACGDRAGTADLLVPEWSGAAGLYAEFSGRAPHAQIAVRVATLDELVDGASLPGRVLLKIDAEGSELAVLRGAAGVIRARQPTLIVEINPASARAAGHTAADVVAELSALGYDRFAEVASYPAEIGVRAVDCTREHNLVALPPSAPSPESSLATRSSTTGG